MASTMEFTEFDSAMMADRLAFIAIALFAVYLITLLASILPIRLLDTARQRRFISACLDSATVALGQLHLAAYLDPGNPTLLKRRDRLAIGAVIGFLLIIPLQAYAGCQDVAVAMNIQAPAPQAIEAVARDSLRVMLSSFALAIAFAMGAQRKGSDVPLLVEWHTILSLRGPRAANPGAGGHPGLPLPGLSAPPEEAYFSRLVPKEDHHSETGIPPPP